MGAAKERKKEIEYFKNRCEKYVHLCRKYTKYSDREILKRLNNRNHLIVYYDIDKTRLKFTIKQAMCPFGKLVKVGGTTCQQCEKFKELNEKRHIVVCGAKRDELKD